jgi:hypothetical protein
MNKAIVNNDILRKVRSNAISRSGISKSLGKGYVVSKTASCIVITSSSSSSSSSSSHAGRTAKKRK